MKLDLRKRSLDLGEVYFAHLGVNLTKSVDFLKTDLGGNLILGKGGQKRDFSRAPKAQAKSFCDFGHL